MSCVIKWDLKALGHNFHRQLLYDYYQMSFLKMYVLGHTGKISDALCGKV